ncbi:MAG: preprotein translocase subunit SecG [Rickettsiales bacterium]|jgi:preprotein translocase subunit SecG|nr:preprotein translocase subunit SecG [Rickettsiales bacterium]
MFSVLLTALIVVTILMIGVILLQKSEGSGMSGSSAASMFAGVLTGASAGNFLTKLTAILAALFFALCMALAIVVSNQGNTRPTSDLRRELAAAAEITDEPQAEIPTADNVPVEPIQIPED